jgi:hypothetical protein
MERGFHHLLEDFHRDKGSALGQGAIGDDFAGDLFDVFGEMARSGHDVKDETANEFKGAEGGFTATLDGAGPQEGIDELKGEEFGEETLEGRSGNSGFVSHPQVDGVLLLKVQA